MDRYYGEMIIEFLQERDLMGKVVGISFKDEVEAALIFFRDDTTMELRKINGRICRVIL